MSEKVMIDGIDVSGCRLRVYNSDLCNGFKMDNSGFHQGHCIQNPNCYYKQLQRAKEENERLKEEIKRLNKPVFLPNIEQEATNKYRKALEEIREDLEQDTTCESRECGCDDYGECLKCVKKTIIEICDEVLK